MENYLRNWRNDLLERQQYAAAIFVGDKLLALTGSDTDAIALAQTHFADGDYTRPLTLLTRTQLPQRSRAARYLAAHCHVKLGRYDAALALLGDKNPTHLATTADSARRKLQHMTAGLSSRQHAKSKASRDERADRSEERDFEEAGNIKYEAGMCYLRGLCFAQQNAFDRAKECYKDAVRIDIQCFEAMDQLMQNKLMGPAEEWDFLESLNFDSISADQTDAQEAAAFTRNLYITRLSKYARPAEFAAAMETLCTHYRLADNADMLLAQAETLFTSSRFEQALDMTSAVLDADAYNFACMPLHLALLFQLEQVNALFALAHDLADSHPQEPCTWLAVGTYYLATERIPEARTYFSKASLMNPHFGPAWIGFAHTFAAEGEGDQAIAAYSTAARLFQGTHLPQLFLGMQELALDNLAIAREYLTTAYNLCDRDPLLINEIGVCAFKEGSYEAAIRHFDLALRLSEEAGAGPHQYRATRLNLAHALRRQKRYNEALEQFNEVIRLGRNDCDTFASKALTLLELDRPLDATLALHQGLALSPQDPVAGELLTRALTQLGTEPLMSKTEEKNIDASLKEKLASSVQVRRSRRREIP
ncbi:TPR-like protein [Piedraia hortae CBS 480.64]|uniref:TPR-like protein n=1 Tax=Piedraia hortae CBS 480.64 TaxID=1314780 RepID=A0A6A7BWX5_9PEZI|nr:TPR-like protein [Piedraia hortae CBS 480.64]